MSASFALANCAYRARHSAWRLAYSPLEETAWPSGQRFGLAIRRSRVRVQLYPHAGFALGRLQFRSSATLVNGQLVASSLQEGSLVRASFWRPLAWGKVTSDAFEYNICACHFLSLSLHLLCSYWIVSTQRKGRNWKINSPRAGSLFLARWRQKCFWIEHKPAYRQGSLQYHFLHWSTNSALWPLPYACA